MSYDIILVPRRPGQTWEAPAQVEAPPFYSGRRRAGTSLVIGPDRHARGRHLAGQRQRRNGVLVALAIGVADLVVGARAWNSSSPPKASA